MLLLDRTTAPDDDAGQALRSLDAACTTLQFINPLQLHGDRSIIIGAILALTIIDERLAKLQVHSEAAE